MDYLMKEQSKLNGQQLAGKMPAENFPECMQVQKISKELRDRRANYRRSEFVRRTRYAKEALDSEEWENVRGYLQQALYIVDELEELYNNMEVVDEEEQAVEG